MDIRDQPDLAGAATRRRGRRSTRVVSTGLMTTHAAPKPDAQGCVRCAACPEEAVRYGGIQ
jgi:hypothetical protein